jgi:hypothetical protein
VAALLLAVVFLASHCSRVLNIDWIGSWFSC